MNRVAFGRSIMRAAAPVTIMAVIACSGPGRFVRPLEIPDDKTDIPQPESRDINVLADGIDKQVVDQIEDIFDFSQHIRKLIGKPKEALNVNSFDEVDNSSWFTNRNGSKKLTLAEISRGPDRGNGPDTSGSWVIKKAKSQGVTPGFGRIVDSKGDMYVIKFDPPGYLELASGAEVVSTKLFYAAGYNTPENYIVTFDPEKLILDDNVKITDDRGRDRFMTQEDLDAILERVTKNPDGAIRALASKFIEGTVLGPFRYEKTRNDDPNDLVPHQYRRELRGLKILAAWLNHFDTKANNSMDSWVEDDGAKYVRHYLMDFGATLGSASHGPMPAHIGFENAFDPKEMSKKLVTLGLHVRSYELPYTIEYTSIGRFTSDNFFPHRYKFIRPNPAFDRATFRDEFWGAKLVMSFTDDQIDAVVKQGQYSDRNAERYLAAVLKERRDIIGRHWFGMVSPLDRFSVVPGNDGYQELHFADLAVEGNLANPQTSNYRYSIWYDSKLFIRNQDTKGRLAVSLPDPQTVTGGNVYLSEDDPLVVTVQSRRSGGKWNKAVKVYLTSGTDGDLILLGIKR